MKIYVLYVEDEANCRGKVDLGYFRKEEDAEKRFAAKADEIRGTLNPKHKEETPRKNYTIFTDVDNYGEEEFEQTILWIQEKELQ